MYCCIRCGCRFHLFVPLSHIVQLLLQLLLKLLHPLVMLVPLFVFLGRRRHFRSRSLLHFCWCRRATDIGSTRSIPLLSNACQHIGSAIGHDFSGCSRFRRIPGLLISSSSWNTVGQDNIRREIGHDFSRGSSFGRRRWEMLLRFLFLPPSTGRLGSTSGGGRPWGFGRISSASFHGIWIGQVYPILGVGRRSRTCSRKQ